jgi:C-terminal processing protease CtpA/Prc
MSPSKIVLAGTLASLLATTSAARPETPAPLQPDALRADFATLYTGLQAAHYDLYARRPKAEYDALYEHMRGDLDRPLPPLEAWRRFQRFAAFGRVAHARIDPPAGAWEAFRTGGGKAFPLFLRTRGERVYIADDFSGLPGLAQGDEIMEVQGQPVQAWLDRARAQVSADNRYLADAQLETQLPMLAWLADGAMQSYTVEVVRAEGRREVLQVPARSREEFAAAGKSRPPRFELDWNAREARVLDDGIGYLRPGPFYDNRPEVAHPWDTTAFVAFIDGAFSDFRRQGVERLLIDLRDNPGGDNSFSDPMLAWFASKPFRFSPQFDIRVSEQTTESNRQRLTTGDDDSVSARMARAYEGKPLRSRVAFPIPEVAPHAGDRFTGRVFLLVNRHSYSNTVLVAAVAQDYGFGTVLGEETADLASTYGAMEKFPLPHTGLEVGYPKARILRPSGDAQARGVIPDVAIETPLTASKEDVVLARALEIVRAAPAKRAEK